MNSVGMKDSGGNLHETDSIGEINHCVCENLPEYDSVGDGLFLHHSYESENDYVMILLMHYDCLMHSNVMHRVTELTR